KGDPDPETTFRGEGGDLHNKEGGRYANDPNPPEPVDTPATVKAEHDKLHLEGLKEFEDNPAYKKQVEHRDMYERYQTESSHLKEIASECGVDISSFTSENLKPSLRSLRDSGQITPEQSTVIRDAFLSERESLKDLKKASESLGEHAADGVIKLREEISLFGHDSGKGAGHLDRVGVKLNPPSITVYEAKGGNAPLGTSKVDGVPHQQGTGPYLQKLMEQDPRIVQALADLIEREGPDARALKEAIENGTIEINYDLVRARPSGTIGLSRFRLDGTAYLPKIPPAS
ncbi:hypothetical protein, partial [Arachnia propionica]|uniref:hypothetical protein n=1 Tax=Arachnia propionica TaxID=1750 RepID=UPI00163B51F0